MTNAHIQFTMHNGHLRGHVTMVDCDEPVTGGLRSTTPVINNFWHVSGIFETETAAAEAARKYLNYDGPVWGVDSRLDESGVTQVYFGSAPKVAKGDYEYVVRTLAI